MKRSIILLCASSFFTVLAVTYIHAYDINIIGSLSCSNSIARHTESFINCLHQHKNLTIVSPSKPFMHGYTQEFKNIVHNKSIPSTKTLTGISVFCNGVHGEQWRRYKAIDNRSTIKFGYCVTERTVVFPAWVKKLNKHFDALLVPDEWLVDVYISSGIKLPIFVLPLSLDLKELLDKPLKKHHNSPFIFGFSGGSWPRKNQKLLIKAFNQEFKNNPLVKLIIHSRLADGFNKVKKLATTSKNSSITLKQKKLSRPEYENFLRSLDCYISLSKGEGFSVIPREMLALGIPCILSDNTAQKTICNSGFVYAVPSNIIEPSYCIYSSQPVGYDFNCSLNDAKKALRVVYNNYQEYLEKAHQGREWIKRYLPAALEKTYTSLVAPQEVILGDHNEIKEDGIITNSKALFDKYQKLSRKKFSNDSF